MLAMKRNIKPNQMITKEFEFLHEVAENKVVLVMAEVEYYAGMRDADDSIKLIGDVIDDEGNVYELTEKQLLEEFVRKFWNEVEFERAEVRSDNMNIYEAKNFEKP